MSENEVGKALARDIAKALVEHKYQEIELEVLELFTDRNTLGPRCKCCRQRNMKRIGPLEYACLKTGQVFTLRELLWPR